jgi:hypothetical protein
MKSPYHYLVLAVVITLSVCAGNLSSNYLTAKYAAYQANIAAEKLRKERQERQAKALEQALLDSEEKRVAEVKSRKNSKKAKNLLIQCSEWRAQNAKLDMRFPELR